MMGMNKKGEDFLPQWFVMIIVLGLGALIIGGGYWLLYGKSSTIINQIDPGAYSTLASVCVGVAQTGSFGASSYCSELKIIDSKKGVYGTCGSKEIEQLIKAGKNEPLSCSNSYNAVLVNSCKSVVGEKLKAGETVLSNPIAVINGATGIVIKTLADCDSLKNYYV